MREVEVGCICILELSSQSTSGRVSDLTLFGIETNQLAAVSEGQPIPTAADRQTDRQRMSLIGFVAPVRNVVKNFQRQQQPASQQID